MPTRDKANRGRMRVWCWILAIGAGGLFASIFFPAYRLPQHAALIDAKYRLGETILSCKDYANLHRGNLPSHLAELFYSPHVMPPKVNLIHGGPSFHTDWAVDRDWDKIKAEVDLHSDLVYSGAGINLRDPGVVASPVEILRSRVTVEGKTLIGMSNGEIFER